VQKGRSGECRMPTIRLLAVIGAQHYRLGFVYVLRPTQQERAEHISKVQDFGNQDPSGHWVMGWTPPDGIYVP